MDAQNEVVKFKLEEENEEVNGGKEKFLEKKGGSSFKKSGFFELALTSFKEDSYFISDLRDSEKKALNEFKEKIESAIKSNQFLLDTAEEVIVKEDQKAATSKEVNAEKPTNGDAKNPDQNDGGTEKKSENGKSGAEGMQSHANDDISIWGIPLLHSKGDERTDVILLKFLRARDFRVNDTFLMLQNCMAWRKKFGADKVLEEDLAFDENLDSVAFMHCCDKDGHPVCYNAYGIFRDKDIYQKIFGDDQKLKKFLRWRVQILEKGIKLLNFKPGGVNAMIQITDLKNMPKRELRAASNQILALFQDNYPEMVAKKVFINVPWYFSALYSMFSPFLTQRTKSKFVIAREGKVTETLYKFISPENVPIQYGGLSKPKDGELGPNKPAAEFTIKGGEKINLEIEGVENCKMCKLSLPKILWPLPPSGLTSELVRVGSELCNNSFSSPRNIGIYRRLLKLIACGVELAHSGATILWDLVVGGWDVTYWAEFVPSAGGSYTTVIDKTRKLSSSDEPVCNSFKASEAGKVVLIIDNTLSRRKKVAAYRYMVKKNLV